MSELIRDPIEGYCGLHGYETMPGRWKLPETVPTQARDDAMAHLPIAQAACAPAEPDQAKKWLGMLGTIVAGNMPAAEAQMRLKAYVGLMRIPAGMVNREVLDRAGRRFKFFPAYAELAEFVDAERAKLEERARRLRLIAEGPRSSASPVRSVVKSVCAPPSAKPAQIELTDGLGRQQILDYWTARFAGQTPAEARAAAENRGKAEDAAE
ncbi:MAG: hypothetical protein F8N37_12120 [Telmatospirillum sp.]|nr:hypothetical protein [Telmatospirillum sp.]